jgi:hypothetical protein
MLRLIVRTLLMFIGHCIISLESSFCQLIEAAQTRRWLLQPLPRWLSHLVLLPSSAFLTFSAVVLRLCYSSNHGQRVHSDVSFTAQFVCFARGLGYELGLCPDAIAKRLYPRLPFGVVAHLQVTNPTVTLPIHVA